MFIGNNYEYNEEVMMEEELEEAERMVRNGCNMRQIRRKQFTYLGQSDIVKLFRKYGRSTQEDEEGSAGVVHW